MKQIFVGSSTRAECYVKTICDFVNSVAPNQIKAVSWRDTFPLGLTTFQALEAMLKTYSGAVLVASPDVGKKPTPNVMLEFGLVAGRLGLSNVALCKVDDVRIPSDLLSLTKFELRSTSGCLDSPDQQLLRTWANALSETIKDVPATNLVHGYTGRWSINLSFDRWRGYEISGGRIATLIGRLDLIIPRDGKHGYGLGKGDVRVHFPNDETKGLKTAAAGYSALFKICWQAEEVRCHPSGQIRLRALNLIRHCSGKPTGHIPDGRLLHEADVAPSPFTWVLTPDPTNESRMKIAVSSDIAD